jgi:lauroyl/myristoyl acyltransferase
MKEEMKNQIEQNLGKLSALFASQGAILLAIHALGVDALTTTGSSTQLITNLAYLSEMKDQLLNEIMQSLNECEEIEMID